MAKPVDPTPPLKRPVSVLKGVGPAREKALTEEAGVATVEDLLYYFPRRYIDRTLSDTTLLQAGREVTLICHVQNHYLAHGKRSRLVVQCRTLSGEGLSLVWFRGVQYLRKLFEPDQTLVVSGRLEFYQGLQIIHPDFESIDPEDEQALVHVGRIIPLYPSGETLKKNHLDSRGFRRLIAAVVEDPDFAAPEILPGQAVARQALLPRGVALQNIHYPENQERLDAARRTLKYEELFLFSLMMYHKALARERYAREIAPLEFGRSREYAALLGRLPFQLTAEQLRAIQEILGLCRGKHSEAFLLQGDVGSGKTVVALAIALHYMETGAQVALLAPTEVLARQHYNSLAGMLGFEGASRLEILTGSDKKKSRAEKLERMQDGSALLVIGTHSLLEDEVVFQRLGLVIIDEQHRFGVGQRETMRGKGVNPDAIAMTATPIPRTLCLTEFADLRLVTLREKPAGRKPIQTMRLGADRRAGLYKSIRKRVSEGRQCYIVYPLIAESEKSDLRAATDAFEELSKTIFPDFRVALLHGRLKSAEKDSVMNDFRQGRVQILVTTSVIEVGVDVPNATVMVIEHAERFGISQLHQLRGRVGRGSEESFCVLVSDADSEDAEERLSAVAGSEDGFHLAEVDMRLRGPGELLGLRQHGLPGFKLADLVQDRELAEAAYRDVREFPNAPPEVREMIRQRFEQGIVIFPN